jgi:hypothetical protein
LEEDVRLGLQARDDIDYLLKSLEGKLDTIKTVLSNYIKEASLPNSLEIDEAFKVLIKNHKFDTSLKLRRQNLSYDIRDSEMFKKSFKAVEIIQSQRSIKPALNKNMTMALKEKFGESERGPQREFFNDETKI